jgi:hypothetical protein
MFGQATGKHELTRFTTAWIWGEATSFPVIVFFMYGHNANTQMSFCVRIRNLGVLKFLKLGLLQIWRSITSFENLRLRWGFKQSCSPHQKLSNDMWDVTFTKGNWSDFWLLMVNSQIGNLAFNLYFGHNLCFKYSNGSCKLILNI